MNTARQSRRRRRVVIVGLTVSALAGGAIALSSSVGAAPGDQDGTGNPTDPVVTIPGSNTQNEGDPLEPIVTLPGDNTQDPTP